MTPLDFITLGAYFIGMIIIGLYSMRRIKKQEDYLMGGRSFGRLLQTFAAFGAGTSADSPIGTARTTYTSGLSGVWAVLVWLFVTPFYWIFGVWYRRLRTLTLGDFFVERYDSLGLGAAYALFGIFFYMVYLSLGFAAVGKTFASIAQIDERILIPAVAVIVLAYGMAGGLHAAYWTDLIQGIMIILLSLMLIPFGLNALADLGGADHWWQGFRVLHERVPEFYFDILGSPRASDFPIHYIVAITLLNLFGIVVQPHMIATGGGSAKTENSARVGLMMGNFLKRFCTLGWCLTSLIALALFAGELTDPDMVWGFATSRLLGPLNLGLVGLMLASLMAALMSSADCYMLITSGLVVRNLYAPYVNNDASERHYIMVARIVGAVTIVGGVFFALYLNDVFDLIKFTWEIPIIFAGAFWLGMFWRKGTRAAAWASVVATSVFFFILPMTLPAIFPGMRTNPELTASNTIHETIVTFPAGPSDVDLRNAEIAAFFEEHGQGDDPDLQPPQPLTVGEPIEKTFTSGGAAIFFTQHLEPLNQAEVEYEIIDTRDFDDRKLILKRYATPMKGIGYFNLDLYLYSRLGIDFTDWSSPGIETMRLPMRILLPIIIFLLVSPFTRTCDPRKLDLFYTKMRVPTVPDPEQDQKNLDQAAQDPAYLRERRLFPDSNLEFSKPSRSDVMGVVIGFIICFLIIACAVMIGKIGA